MKFLEWEIIPAGERDLYRAAYDKLDTKLGKEQFKNHLLTKENERIRKTIEELRSSCDKYKELYLDEMQKRLEMAELVRKLEGKQKDEEIIF